MTRKLSEVLSEYIDIIREISDADFVSANAENISVRKRRVEDELDAFVFDAFVFDETGR